MEFVDVSSAEVDPEYRAVPPELKSVLRDLTLNVITRGTAFHVYESAKEQRPDAQFSLTEGDKEFFEPLLLSTITSAMLHELPRPNLTDTGIDKGPQGYANPRRVPGVIGSAARRAGGTNKGMHGEEKWFHNLKKDQDV